jgi:hypothetical protein
MAKYIIPALEIVKGDFVVGKGTVKAVRRFADDTADDGKGKPIDKPEAWKGAVVRAGIIRQVEMEQYTQEARRITIETTAGEPYTISGDTEVTVYRQAS